MFTHHLALRIPLGLCFVLPLLVFGCAVHAKGMLSLDQEGMRLRSLNQADRRLLEMSPQSGLKNLDGHLIEVWGQGGRRSIRVERYRVLEGTHGLAHWVGRVSRQGGRVGLIDVEGSQFRPFVGPNESALNAEYGSTVLVEGYIEGAGQVRVVYYRVLVESGD